MKTLITFFIAAVIAAIGAIGYARSGLYDVSAGSAHSKPVGWLLSTTSRASIERQATGVRVPDLSDPALAQTGASDFAAMCTGCHGAPGQAPDAMGLGLNPPAPDLADSAQRMSAAQLFWVTKHGIRMTGMPAWGVTHDDDLLWPVVAFMTRLPELDAGSYQALLASAGGMGHHDADEARIDHDHGDADSTSPDDHYHPDSAAPEFPGRQVMPDEGGHDHDSHDHDE
jgi:mono/diheme cytochrome c family protein